MSRILQQTTAPVNEDAMLACASRTQSDFGVEQSLKEAFVSPTDSCTTDAPATDDLDTDDRILSAELSEQDQEDDDLRATTMAKTTCDECEVVDLDDRCSDGFSDDEDEICDIARPMENQKTWDTYEEIRREINSVASCPAPVVIQPPFSMPQCMLVCCSSSGVPLPVCVPFQVPPNMSMISLPTLAINNTHSTQEDTLEIEKQSTLQPKRNRNRNRKLASAQSVLHQGAAVPTHPPGSFASAEKSKSRTARKVPFKNATHTRTTVMLRNLPNFTTRDMLLDILDMLGFRGKYDFVHMPLDINRLSCLGFGFVNLKTHTDALQFFERAQGFCNWKAQSNKVLNVSWSDPLQGLSANIQRYRNASVMHSSVPAECKPLLFGASGEPIPFPKPTISVRAPRNS